MRLNNSAFDRNIKKDGSEVRFWHYDKATSNEEYDADTQEPTNSGSLVKQYADVLDFNLNELQKGEGLIETTSKKYVVSESSVLDTNDEVIDADNKVLYIIVFVQKKANRKILFVNIVKDGQTRS